MTLVGDVTCPPGGVEGKSSNVEGVALADQYGACGCPARVDCALTEKEETNHKVMSNLEKGRCNKAYKCLAPRPRAPG